MQILEAIGHVIQISKPKTETPIGGLNISSSKSNRKREIKVSNLEESRQAISAPKNTSWQFRHLFWVFSLYDYLLELRRRFASEALCFFREKNYEFGNNSWKRYNFETAEIKNLNFGT